MVTIPLFDAEPREGAPRCRMCARPARWISAAQEWGMYCAGRACSNRSRLCQICGDPFVINVDGAGTKYCSTACKGDGYRVRPRLADAVKCAWCGKDAQHRPVKGLWPYVCDECFEPIKHLKPRLRNHRVPIERVRQLLTDPGCEVCGADIVSIQRVDNRYHAPLVVDHDHACCPSNYSCGKCIRGLLCQPCNWACGHVNDDPDIARRLAEYLAAWQH